MKSFKESLSAWKSRNSDVLAFNSARLKSRESTRRFALIAGALMLAMGVTSLIPWLSSDSGLVPLKFDFSYGNYLGLFPMNIINKAALCFFGLGGLMAYFNRKDSGYASACVARWMSWVMIPGAILGLIPLTQTVFGYWPLYGAEIAAHGVLGLLGAYFGYYVYGARAQRRFDDLDAEAREENRYRDVA